MARKFIVKAIGTEGKGAIVCNSVAQLEITILDLVVNRIVGKVGKLITIEDISDD